MGARRQAARGTDAKEAIEDMARECWRELPGATPHYSHRARTARVLTLGTSGGRLGPNHVASGRWCFSRSWAESSASSAATRPISGGREAAVHLHRPVVCRRVGHRTRFFQKSSSNRAESVPRRFTAMSSRKARSVLSPMRRRIRAKAQTNMNFDETARARRKSSRC